MTVRNGTDVERNLVTGGAGVIGSCVVRRLVAATEYWRTLGTVAREAFRFLHI